MARGKTEAEMADDIEALLGDKPDVTIECSGVETSIRSDQSISRLGRIIKLFQGLEYSPPSPGGVWSWWDLASQRFPFRL